MVLIQASNAYASSAPILRALQQLPTLPMAQYLVPGLAPAGGFQAQLPYGRAEGYHLQQQHPHIPMSPVLRTTKLKDLSSENPKIKFICGTLPVIQALALVVVIRVRCKLDTKMPPFVCFAGLFNNIPVPAYLSDDHAYLDFSSICDKGSVQAHPHRSTYLARLSRMRVRDIRTSPVQEWLMACTSLDGPQAAALIAGMTQEFSLIQGPPGTGE